MAPDVKNAPADFPVSRRKTATAASAKRGSTVLVSSDACPQCGHLMSVHPVEQSGHCDSCACVAQDVAPLKVNA